jgi:hypothetical protein
MTDELPRDPDIDDLPDELRLHPGPFFVEGTDPDTAELHRQQVTQEELGAAFADARRLREADDE